MARAGSAYVVRDDGAGTASGNVDKLYPDTLKGLTEAPEEARFRSYAGPPQVKRTELTEDNERVLASPGKQGLTSGA